MVFILTITNPSIKPLLSRYEQWTFSYEKPCWVYQRYQELIVTTTYTRVGTRLLMSTNNTVNQSVHIHKIKTHFCMYHIQIHTKSCIELTWIDLIQRKEDCNSQGGGHERYNILLLLWNQTTTVSPSSSLRYLVNSLPCHSRWKPLSVYSS